MKLCTCAQGDSPGQHAHHCARFSRSSRPGAIPGSIDHLAGPFKRAITRRDHLWIGRHVDLLRGKGYNYAATFDVAHRLTKITLPEWDALLDECGDFDAR